MKSSMRGSDAVVRYGGDEFLMLLADTSAAGAQIVVDRIYGKLDDWNAAGNLEDFRISVSICIAEWHDGDTLDEMLDGADRRMFERNNDSKTVQNELKTVWYTAFSLSLGLNQRIVHRPLQIKG